MFKNLFGLFLIALVLTVPCLAQKLESPTLTPKPLTAAQEAVVREGVALHRERKFDEAILKYESVLKENSENPIVLYQLGYAHYAKRDFAKAAEFGYKVAAYKSEFLKDAYSLIGNALDDQKNYKQAVEAYQFGIKQFPNDFLLHFNLGISYARQNLGKEARESLKRAATLNPKHPGSQLVLADVFMKGNYRVPALLAASRFFTLEPASERSRLALKIIADVMQGGVSQGGKPNEINILANLNAPTDEGDFGSIELVLGIGKAAGMTEKNKGKTESQLFAEQFDTFIALLDEADKKDKSKFVWQYYVPFFVEMKQRKLTEPFAYVVRLRLGDETARKWLGDNESRLIEFERWVNAYQFPAVK